jgi:hypothetical protein
LTTRHSLTLYNDQRERERERASERDFTVTILRTRVAPPHPLRVWGSANCLPPQLSTASSPSFPSCPAAMPHCLCFYGATLEQSPAPSAPANSTASPSGPFQEASSPPIMAPPSLPPIMAPPSLHELAAASMPVTVFDAAVSQVSSPPAEAWAT